MDKGLLAETATRLVAPGKGILAADESDATIKKRFDAIGVPSTEITHRDFRELLFSTEGISEFISGIILFDETIKQKTSHDVSIPQYIGMQEIIPGIKVDLGTTELPETMQEKVTLGLDGLHTRLSEYHKLGARFTKWRAVFRIGAETPSSFAIQENARILAEYALICQRAGFVPIVEPEVLMDGDHTLEKCRDVTKNVLTIVFEELKKHEVYLPGILLKPNMILPGEDSTQEVSPETIAEETLHMLSFVVPSEVPGIVFLSGGQTPEKATQNLAAINRLSNGPWKLSFSFGRALEQPVLEEWQGDPARVKDAQQIFLMLAKANSLAVQATS